MTFTRDRARAISLATAFVQDGIPFSFEAVDGRYRFWEDTGPEETTGLLIGPTGVPAGYTETDDGRQVVFERIKGYAEEENEQAQETAQETEQDSDGSEPGDGAKGDSISSGGEPGHSPGAGRGTDSPGDNHGDIQGSE